ncbi:MAG: helix-turn-helix transcriptional regulator [Propionibacteriaceae bacterium]|nr:helix-turn-helix transcriptional regulator [Propionibacteriaceae bacterium]
MSLSQNVAAEVRSIIAHKKIRNMSVAEALGVSEFRARKLIRGTRPFSIPQVETLATFLNIDLWDQILQPAFAKGGYECPATS